MTVGAGDLSVSGSSADLGVHAHPAASATHLSKTCVSVLAPLLDHVFGGGIVILMTLTSSKLFGLTGANWHS